MTAIRRVCGCCGWWLQPQRFAPTLISSFVHAAPGPRTASELRTIQRSTHSQIRRTKGSSHIILEPRLTRPSRTPSNERIPSLPVAATDFRESEKTCYSAAYRHIPCRLHIFTETYLVPSCLLETLHPHHRGPPRPRQGRPSPLLALPLGPTCKAPNARTSLPQGLSSSNTLTRTAK